MLDEPENGADQEGMEVLLCSDFDFRLFKDIRFDPQHEVHIDVQSGTVQYNSA